MTITPNKLRGLKRTVKDAEKVYRARRQQAVALAHAHGSRISREDAVNEALASREWLRVARQRLAQGLAQGVEKGSNVSPNARERAYNSGRWNK